MGGDAGVTIDATQAQVKCQPPQLQQPIAGSMKCASASCVTPHAATVLLSAAHSIYRCVRM